MPDMDEMKEGKKYYTDVPQQTEGFFSKRIERSGLGNEKSPGPDL